MLKPLIFTTLAAALIVNVGHALDNPTSKVVIPISAMPAWGTIFANMNRLSSMEQEERASNVVRYIESLQAK
jgi:hypothetical protein